MFELSMDFFNDASKSFLKQTILKTLLPPFYSWGKEEEEGSLNFNFFLLK